MKTHRNLLGLSEAYVYATEVNLATLRELALLQSSSPARIARQRAICLGMLRWCASVFLDEDAVDWGTPQCRSFPRVSEVLSSASVEAALDALLQRWSSSLEGAAVSQLAQRTTNTSLESGERCAH